MSLPLLLAAAEPGLADSFHQITEKFGLEPKYIIFQAISFLILFAVLYWKGIKPTIAAMDERKSKVEAGMKYAKEMEAKLAAAQIETATLLKNAQVEATKIIESARVTAKEFLEKQTQEATQKANDLIVKGQQSIELEHRKMLAEARTEIATLVVKTTERVLAKQLSDADRSRYNEAAARELTLV